MKKPISHIVLILFLLISVFSCKTLKQRRYATSNDLKAINVYDSIINHQAIFNAFNAKFTVKYKADKKSMSLKGNMKILKDSVIWVSLSPGFGIEAARLICTKDSVFLIDRISKTLTKANYNFLMKKFKLDVDYSSLESILTDRFFIYPTHEDPKTCFVKEFNFSSDSTIIKAHRKTVSLLENIISINPHSYLISNYIINDFKLRRSLNISYKKGNFEDIKSFPASVLIHSTNTGKSLNIDLVYKRVNLKSSEKISYNFPSSYTLKKY